MRLDNKVAVVTGAASGIGLATAKRFLEEGAKVMLADLDGDAAQAAARDIDASGDRAGAVACDVSIGADCDAMIDSATQRFGPVDVLHANAGLPFTGSIDDVDDATIERILAVNLKGALFSARAVVPGMKQRRSGCIVFTSSLQGIFARPNYAPYTAAKHGVTGLMKGLALELAPWGIRVNAVAPGPTKTPMLNQFLRGMASDEDESDEHALERFRKSVPLGRLLEPVDVANGVLFLASEEARMVSGHTLVIDGATTAG